MLRGPQGQKRPADAIGAAVRVARIATGEEAETPISVQTASQILGQKGGQARARKLTPAWRGLQPLFGRQDIGADLRKRRDDRAGDVPVRRQRRLQAGRQP